jgi:glycosyltransferase involved in cell wall biosynthesis
MLELGLALLELGHEVTVACHDHAPDGEHLGAGTLEVRSVTRTSGRPVSGAREALVRFWRDMPRVAALVDGADVVNAHEWPALHAGRLAAARHGAPLVWHRNDHTIFERALIRGVRHDANIGAFGRAVRLAGSMGDLLDARRAHAIVTLDEDSRAMAERAFGRPTVAIPAPPAAHFFDPPERSGARARLGVAPGEVLVLGVGIMNAHRRFEDLVDAMSALDEPRARALIVGSDHVHPAYGAAICERIARRRLAGRVALPLRSFSEAELCDAYAAADVFVFPNDHRQSWGLAPLEALAAGTPVVVSRTAGVADALDGRPGVALVDPHSPCQIADAIRALVAAGREQAAPTRAWLERELAPRTYAERVAQVYRACLPPAVTAPASSPT